MKQIVISVDDTLYKFYQKVGECAGGISAEKVMSDALFKLAGDLSVDALRRAGKPEEID